MKTKIKCSLLFIGVLLFLVHGSLINGVGVVEAAHRTRHKHTEMIDDHFQGVLPTTQMMVVERSGFVSPHGAAIKPGHDAFADGYEKGSRDGQSAFVSDGDGGGNSGDYDFSPPDSSADDQPSPANEVLLVVEYRLPSTDNAPEGAGPDSAASDVRVVRPADVYQHQPFHLHPQTEASGGEASVQRAPLRTPLGTGSSEDVYQLQPVVPSDTTQQEASVQYSPPSGGGQPIYYVVKALLPTSSDQQMKFVPHPSPQPRYIQVDSDSLPTPSNAQSHPAQQSSRGVPPASAPIPKGRTHPCASSSLVKRRTESLAPSPQLVNVPVASAVDKEFVPPSGSGASQVVPASYTASPSSKSPSTSSGDDVTQPSSNGQAHRKVATPLIQSDGFTKRVSSARKLREERKQQARTRAKAGAESYPTEASVNISFCKRRPNGFYQHPNDCSRIVQCFGGDLFEYPSCSNGLAFNESKQLCDYRHLVDGCKHGGSASSVQSVKAEGGEKKGCPRGRVHGDHIADPKDCSRFYRCVRDHLEPMSCPKGTVFNSKLDVCDFPSQVPGCEKSVPQTKDDGAATN